MFIKSLAILLILFSLSTTIKASLGFASAALGETFKFDFGPETKTLRINRNDIEEILQSGKKGTQPNVHLSEEGVLTISPVTKNDFGMYSAMYKIEKHNNGEVMGVAPPAIVLTEKEESIA